MHSTCCFFFGIDAPFHYTQIFCFEFFLSYIRFPFDWKTPVGFVFATLLECLTMLYVNVMNSSFLSLAIGSYFWSMSCIKDLKNNLNSIRKFVKPKSKRSQFTKQILDAVDHHSKLIELSLFAKSLSLSILCTFYLLLIISSSETIFFSQIFK